MVMTRDAADSDEEYMNFEDREGAADHDDVFDG